MVVRIPAGDITNLHYNFVVAKPLVFIGNIISWDLNHLPLDLHCDVLPIELWMAYSNSRGKIIYEGYGDHRWGTGQALVLFFIFLLTVRQIRMFFSLKHSASQGESSLKISARWGLPFRRS